MVERFALKSEIIFSAIRIAPTEIFQIRLVTVSKRLVPDSEPHPCFSQKQANWQSLIVTCLIGKGWQGLELTRFVLFMGQLVARLVLPQCRSLEYK